MPVVHAQNASQKQTNSGADPGPVVGGGANLSKRGANLIYFICFSEKPHEIKEILVCRGEGGRAPGASPLDPPL